MNILEESLEFPFVLLHWVCNPCGKTTHGGENVWASTESDAEEFAQKGPENICIIGFELGGGRVNGKEVTTGRRGGAVRDSQLGTL